MDLGLHDGWLWAIGGVLLLIAEVVAPGFFLVFLGVAAIATGLFTLLFDLGIAPQLALFVIYTGLALLIGKRWYGEPDLPDHIGGINDPSRRLIGKTVTVVAAIDEHQRPGPARRWRMECTRRSRRGRRTRRDSRRRWQLPDGRNACE